MEVILYCEGNQIKGIKMTNKELRLTDALWKVHKESKKSKPDADKIFEIVSAALEYEIRNS